MALNVVFFLSASEGKHMKVLKSINNNVVSCLDENGREWIAMGRGLGFSLRAGDKIDQTKVEKL